MDRVLSVFMPLHVVWPVGVYRQDLYSLDSDLGATLDRSFHTGKILAAINNLC